MDKRDLIQKRKGKCLAQLASSFEQQIEPRIPNGVAQRFKAEMRGQFATLANDAAELAELDDKTELNAHAQAVRDTFDRGAGVGGDTT